MANNVPLTLSVSTVGADSINKLQDDIKALGKEGADAAPEFANLVAEIDKLSQQEKLVGSMKELGDEIDQLKVAQTAAKTTSTALGVTLSDLATETQRLSLIQREAKAALEAEKNALQDTGLAMKGLRAGLTDLAVGSDAYKAKVQQLVAEQIASRQAIRDLVTAHGAAKQATAAAATAEGEYAAKLKTTDAILQATEKKLVSRDAALDATRATLQATGIATHTVIDAEAELLQSFNKSTAAINNVAEAHRKATAAAKGATDINEALGAIGVRSAAAIKAEIDRVNAAMRLLESSGTLAGRELQSAMSKSAADVRVLERELRGVNGELTLGDRAASLFKGSMGQFAAGSLIANGIQEIAMRVVELGRAFVAAVVQGDQMKRGLNAIYKDAGLAASQIDFLRRSSSSAGVAVGEISKEFVKFSAAMHFANVPIEKSNALFLSLTKASAALGLSSDETGGALNALGQMASKGTVSMEELRQQLGDRLPGALGLTAKGMGITEASLIKLVSSGNLAFEDFVDPFTDSLKELDGTSDGLVSTWGRLRTAMTVMAQSAGDAGWTTILTVALKGLGLVLGTVVFLLNSFFEALFLASSAVVRAAETLWKGSAAWDGYGEQVAKSGERIRLVGAALTAVVAQQQVATTSTTAHANALLNSADAATRVAGALLAARGATDQSTVAAKLAADTTLMGAENIAKFNVEAGRLIEYQEVATEASVKNAKAVKLQGDARIELAKVSGDAVTIANAETAAADAYAAALANTAISQRAEVDILLVQRQRIMEVKEARGKTTAEIKAQTEALSNKIATGLAEAEQSEAAAKNAAADAFSRKLATEVLRDHSNEVGKYSALMIVAQADVERLTQAEVDGWATKQQVTAATLELARVTTLYKDALNDQVAALELDTKLKSAAIQVSSAQAEAGVRHYESLAKQARALGDTATAQYYDIRAKEEAIKVIQFKMQIEQLQNAAALLEIDLKRKVVTGTAEEVAVKNKLFDIEVQMIKVKQAGNQAMQDAIRAIEGEIDAMRRGADVRGGSTSGIHADTQARTTNANAIRAQATALKELTNEEKRAAKLSGQNAVDNSLQFKVRDKLNAGVLDSSDVGDVKSVIAAIKQNMVINEFARNQGALSVAGIEDDQRWRGTLAQLQGFLAAQQQGQGNSEGSSHTVTVNIGGTSSAINVASTADANNLINLMKQLGSASQTAA